jgi:hypothetical protein
VRLDKTSPHANKDHKHEDELRHELNPILAAINTTLRTEITTTEDSE